MIEFQNKILEYLYAIILRALDYWFSNFWEASAIIFSNSKYRNEEKRRWSTLVPHIGGAGPGSSRYCPHPYTACSTEIQSSQTKLPRKGWRYNGQLHPEDANDFCMSSHLVPTAACHRELYYHLTIRTLKAKSRTGEIVPQWQTTGEQESQHGSPRPTWLQMQFVRWSSDAVLRVLHREKRWLFM